jgi:hypothetical protein
MPSKLGKLIYLVCLTTYLGYLIFNFFYLPSYLPSYLTQLTYISTHVRHITKNNNFIPICWKENSLKFIIICWQKNSPYEGGDAEVKNLTSQCENEEFKSSSLQPRVF